MNVIARVGVPAAIAAWLLAAPAGAAEKVLWVNDWVPGGDKAAVYIGVHQGFFAAEGLEVEIQSGRGSADAVTKVASGVAEVSASGISAVMQARAEGNAPVKAILSIYTKQPDSIFTVAGSGISTLKDLEGKKIATGTFSSSNVVWPLVLEANKVDAAKIELVKTDPPALAPLLATGKVAGAVSWVTNVPLYERAFASTGKKLQVIPWFEFGFEGYAYTLIASEKMIRERPEVLRKFVRAYRKSIEAGLADPKVAAVSLKAKVAEADIDVAEGQWRASMPLMVNNISQKHGMGAFDPALLKVTWEWVAKSLKIPADKIDPQSIVDRSFLQ